MTILVIILKHLLKADSGDKCSKQFFYIYCIITLPGISVSICQNEAQTCFLFISFFFFNYSYMATNFHTLIYYIS